MIEIQLHSELAQKRRNELNRLIQLEFGHISLVRQTSWAIPKWTIIFYKGEEIAFFYNVIERKVCIDERWYSVAGINNVITPPKFRGQGLASLTLQTTESFLFDQLKAEVGLLLCAEPLVPFYHKLGWYKLECPVYFNQPDGTEIWPANTMLLTKNKKITPKQIDLNGLPW